MTDKLQSLIDTFFCSVNINTFYSQNQKEKLADWLRENGAIVPPCKVGDTVYAVDKRSGLWWRGKTIAFYYVSPIDMQFAVAFEDGEVAIYDADCVFPTKEEADQALRQRKEDGKND